MKFKHSSNSFVTAYMRAKQNIIRSNSIKFDYIGELKHMTPIEYEHMTSPTTSNNLFYISYRKMGILDANNILCFHLSIDERDNDLWYTLSSVDGRDDTYLRSLDIDTVIKFAEKYIVTERNEMNEFIIKLNELSIDKFQLKLEELYRNGR